MPDYTVNTQSVVFRKLKNGRKIYLRIGYDEVTGEYLVKPCDPPKDTVALAEEFYISQISVTDPLHAQHVIDTFNNYPLIANKRRVVKK